MASTPRHVSADGGVPAPLLPAIRRLASVDEGGALPGPVHLAIGMFDGVHRGHQAVIEAAVRSARHEGGTSAVLTFRPHPSVVLRPAQPTRLILDSAAQAEQLHHLGVAAVITQPFTREFAAIRADRFLAWLRERLPGLAAVYVGQNFRFGAGGQGNVDLLVATGRAAGVTVYSAPGVNVDGQPVNSTRIRSLLVAGEVAGANALLGYRYFARGPVVPGKRLGRTLGFPTLNLNWDPELRPRFGVYAVSVGAALGSAGSGRPAVANYGLRPTVEAAASEPRLEAHVLGECPYSDGDWIRVEWQRFLRPEMKFESIEALRTQIVRDVAEATAALSTNPSIHP
jgi:riboflavin kinase/FMN adenylyltransferase